jgi:hypothetical protein
MKLNYDFKMATAQCRSNNMMFSEDESEMKLVDFQLTGLWHPAKDLWHFLSTATDANFRRDHLGNLVT